MSGNSSRRKVPIRCLPPAMLTVIGTGGSQHWMRPSVDFPKAR